MIQPVNINYPEGQSNWSLRGRKLPLLAKVCRGFVPSGDGWEEVWEEVEDLVRYRSSAKARDGRKQMAARCVSPKSVRIVPLSNPPVTKAVAMAILSGDSEVVKVAKKVAPTRNKQVDELKAEIAKLMKLLGQ